jgi:hypothetical protein
MGRFFERDKAPLMGCRTGAQVSKTDEFCCSPIGSLSNYDVERGRSEALT